MDISDLVSVEERVRWCNEVIPALRERCEESPQAAMEWLKSELDADQRVHLRSGIEAIARTNDPLGPMLLPYFS
jgi:hypothetical protein